MSATKPACARSVTLCPWLRGTSAGACDTPSGYRMVSQHSASCTGTLAFVAQDRPATGVATGTSLLGLRGRQPRGVGSVQYAVRLLSPSSASTPGYTLRARKASFVHSTQLFKSPNASRGRRLLLYCSSRGGRASAWARQRPVSPANVVCMPALTSTVWTVHTAPHRPHAGPGRPGVSAPSGLHGRPHPPRI